MTKSLDYIIFNMKSDQSSYSSPQLTYDSEGYVTSFDVQTSTNQELQEFYHKYGFIIFRDIVSDHDNQATIDALWSSTIEYVKQIGGKQIYRDDPSTWGNIRGFHKAFGFVGDGILEDIQFWKNRQNPKVYKAFKRGYEANTKKPLEEDLVACLDRGSMMLPSGIKKEWITQDLYHFDIDPWSWVGRKPNKYKKYDYDPDTNYLMLGEGNYDKNIGYTKLAGVLALSDTNEESGGFQCACGFQNYIKQWCQENPHYICITQDANLVANFKKLFMRKRSLLVFSRQLPHNIYQNTSKNFRYAQYLRMTPLSSLLLDNELIQKRRKLIKMLMPKQLKISDPISRQIFMMKNLQLQEAQNGLQKVEQKGSKEIKDAKVKIQRNKENRLEESKQRCTLF